VTAKRVETCDATDMRTLLLLALLSAADATTRARRDAGVQLFTDFGPVGGTAADALCNAPVVVAGTITEVKPFEADDGSIASRLTVQIARSLRGDLEGRTIVTTASGTFDGRTTRPTTQGQPQPIVGARYVLALTPDDAMPTEPDIGASILLSPCQPFPDVVAWQATVDPQCTCQP
jgi:hypothetical protein